jgi:hypothetical protein
MSAARLHPCVVLGLFALPLLVACAQTPPEDNSSTGGSSGRGGSGSGTGGSSGGSTGSMGTGGTGTPLPLPPNAVWRRANLTNFESHPDPGSEECVHYGGCTWAGQFAFVSGKQTEAWVMNHNIAAVHAKDADAFKLKTLRLRQNGRMIDVTVFDQCSDGDCSGCCTRNSSETGFLIDIEKYTMQRFGSGDGLVEFVCLDCK